MLLFFTKSLEAMGRLKFWGVLNLCICAGGTEEFVIGVMGVQSSSVVEN